MDVVGLKRSWASVAAYGDQVPLFFYSTLFLTEPGTRRLFPVSMAGQRDRFVTALGRIVSSVDDADVLAPFLQQLGRDHRRFAVGREHFPMVGAALLATLEHFSGPAWTPELAADWDAAYRVVAAAMIDAAEAAADQPPWWQLEIVEHERRTIDVAVLRVVPDQALPYVAGQSIAVEVPSRPRLWRWYSPATLPGADGGFELHVRIVDGGPVSTALVHGTQKGDVLRAGAAVGTRLVLGPDARPDLVLVAGGTGLAPMKALIEQVAAQGGDHRVHLFWGVRRQRELYDLPALRALVDAHAWLRVVPCVSDERPFGDEVEPGWAADVALRYGAGAGHEIYLCGSPDMVRGSREALGAAHVPPDRVHIEEFGDGEAFGGVADVPGFEVGPGAGNEETVR